MGSSGTGKAGVAAGGAVKVHLFASIGVIDESGADEVTDTS